MKPKDIYDLPTLAEYTHWADSLAFFEFTEKEVDEELFDFEAAKEDERIEVLLKAESEHHDPQDHVSYWVITFDGKPVGLCRFCGRHQNLWDKLITNYPLYQAMVGYVKTVYTPGQTEFVVAEDKDIPDLEDLYGWVIDKSAPSNMREEK